MDPSVMGKWFPTESKENSFWKTARRGGFCFRVILLRLTSEPFLLCFLSILISEEEGNIGKQWSSWFP